MARQKILLIDLSNMYWLSRSPHTHEESLKGGHPIVQQWLFSFNMWVRIHEPTSVIFLGDGYPKFRYDAQASYKAGRAEKSASDPMTADFSRQKKEIKNLIIDCLPVYYLYHPSLEADDLFFIVCKYFNDKNVDVELMGISTDDDWRQMMQRYDNVSLWQPVKKEFKEKPTYDFVKYKAIMGDSSDNIPGFPRIGKKTSIKLASDEMKFKEWYDNLDDAGKTQYENNLFMVNSESSPEDYQRQAIELLETFKFQHFKSEHLKIYCRHRKLFRFLGKFDEKIANLNRLNKFIIEEKEVNNENNQRENLDSSIQQELHNGSC